MANGQLGFHLRHVRLTGARLKGRNSFSGSASTASSPPGAPTAEKSRFKCAPIMPPMRSVRPGESELCNVLSLFIDH